MEREPAKLGLAVLFLVTFTNILTSHASLSGRHLVIALVLAVQATLFMVYISPLPWRHTNTNKALMVLEFGGIMAVYSVLAACVVFSLGRPNLPFLTTVLKGMKFFWVFYSIPMMLGGLLISQWRRQEEAKEKPASEAAQESALCLLVRPYEEASIRIPISELTHAVLKHRKVLVFHQGQPFMTDFKTLEDANKVLTQMERVKRNTLANPLLVDVARLEPFGHGIIRDG